MVDRVLVGKRSTNEFGLFVSKAGFDVTTALESNLLLSTNTSTLQIVDKGVVSPLISEQALVLPDVGFKPFVILNCARYQIGLRYTSNTLAYFRRFSDRGASLNANLYYYVTNLPWG
ncbi:hypothetical protein [Maritalea sp.]|jgi:hypothetical protein|uniref:hypothetical protein n=1 Tax=Maritalea sp. TaxID=2003361 RepID=UPI0039E2E5AD